MAIPNTKFTLSNYPEKIDDYVVRVAGQVVNANLVNRADYVDYVKAKDFNALRDAVLATQDTLGEMPHSTFATVKARLDYLASHNDDYYDLRYVGIQLSTIPGTEPDPTILGHVHDGKIVNGIQVNPSKIDLTTSVTNKLPSANILLDVANANALVASKIYVSAGVTIVNALDGKLNTSGGTIATDLTVNGDMTVNRRMTYSSFFEAWVGDNLNAGAGGTVATDTNHTIGSWTGSHIKNNTKSAAPGSKVLLCATDSTLLRYGLYSVIFRVYVNGVSSDPNADMFHIVATDDGKAPNEVVVTAGKLIEDSWNSVCLTFQHKYTSTNKVTFSINYHTSTAADIYCDGITVVPTHTAIWG